MTREFVPPAEGGSYVFDPATGALDLVERGGVATSGTPEPTSSTETTEAVAVAALAVAEAIAKKPRKD